MKNKVWLWLHRTWECHLWHKETGPITVFCGIKWRCEGLSQTIGIETN